MERVLPNTSVGDQTFHRWSVPSIFDWEDQVGINQTEIDEIINNSIEKSVVYE
jgi:hypothetical protein